MKNVRLQGAEKSSKTRNSINYGNRLCHKKFCTNLYRVYVTLKLLSSLPHHHLKYAHPFSPRNLKVSRSLIMTFLIADSMKTTRQLIKRSGKTEILHMSKAHQFLLLIHMEYGYYCHSHHFSLLRASMCSRSKPNQS